MLWMILLFIVYVCDEKRFCGLKFWADERLVCPAPRPALFM